MEVRLVLYSYKKGKLIHYPLTPRPSKRRNTQPSPMAIDKFAAAGSNAERRMDTQEDRITAFVVLSCIVAASGGILFGYDIGISGGVTATSSFLKRFFPDVYEKMRADIHTSNYCKFNSEVLTSFTSSLYLAGLVASLFASRITDRYGRRSSMLGGGALFLAGSAIGGAAVNIYMLILARMLLGIAVGFTNQTIPMYLSELSSPKHRGALTGGFEICIHFGILVANLINYGTQKIESGWGWRISLSLAALPATFLLIGALFLPETPSSIILRGGNLQEARLVLQKVRGKTNVDMELNHLAEVAAEASKAAEEEHPLRRILRRNYRPQLVMALFLPFFQQVTGINAVNFYAPVMFRTVGQKESASLMSTVITRCISLTGTLVASLGLVDRLGRRPLFLTGGIVMVAAHVVLGAVLAAELHDHGSVSSTGLAYLVLSMMCVFMGSFGWSWGPLPWLVTSEIFPLEIRSAGLSIQVAVNFFFSFAVAQSVLQMLCSLRSGIFFFFGGWVVLMTAFVFFLLPETKGLPIDQMGTVWRHHWYWKKFSACDTNGDEDKAAVVI